MGRRPLFAWLLTGASIGCGPGAIAEHDSGSDGAADTSSGAPSTTGAASTSSTSSSTSAADDSSSTSSATSDEGSTSAHESSSTGVSVVPGVCGDGVFDPRSPYCYAEPAVLDPTPAYDIALVDMTDDGVPDLVAASEGGLAVLPGLGADEYGPSELVALPCTPTRIVVADIDLQQDSHADVAVICPDDDALVVLHTLEGEPREQLPIVATGGEPIDFVWYHDWDGVLGGYAVAEASAGTVTAYVLDDEGTFVVDRIFDVGGRPNALAMSEAWLATADAETDTVSIHWLSPPDEPPQQVTHAVHLDPAHLRASWFGDVGGPKLMVVAAGADELTIYKPEGDALTEQQSATFPGGPVHYDVGRQPVGADLVMTPIIVVARTAGTVALSPANTGESFFLQPPEVTIDVGPEPLAVLAVTRSDDLDDLVIASAASGVSMLRADP